MTTPASPSPASLAVKELLPWEMAEMGGSGVLLLQASVTLPGFKADLEQVIMCRTEHVSDLLLRGQQGQVFAKRECLRASGCRKEFLPGFPGEHMTEDKAHHSRSVLPCL